jgi:hypothetical protein
MKAFKILYSWEMCWRITLMPGVVPWRPLLRLELAVVLALLVGGGAVVTTRYFRALPLVVLL